MTARAIYKALLLTVILIVVIVLWLLGTTSGLRAVWQLGSDQLDGLEVSELEGSLAGGFQLRDFQYRSDSLRVFVQSASLGWRPEKLIRGTFHVDSLQLDGLRVEQLLVAQKDDDPQELVLPERLPLPVDISVSQLLVNQIEFVPAPGATAIVINSVRARLALTQNTIDITDLDVVSPSFNINGALATDLASNYTSHANLQWDVLLAELPSLSGVIDLNGNAEKAGIRLTAAFDNSLAKLELVGDIAQLLAEPSLNLDLSWQSLQWPLTSPSVHASKDTAALLQNSNGQLKVNGPISKYRAQGQADFSTSMGGGDLTIQAGGGKDGIQFDQVTVNALDGQINANGNLNWEQALTSNFDINAEGINPVELAPEWPGDLSFSLRGSHSGSNILIHSLQANGTLREQPLKLDGVGKYDGEGLTLKRFELESGRSSLQGHGSVSENLDFSWVAQSPDLGDLYPGATGRFASEGKLLGSRSAPLIRAELEAHDVSLDELSVENISAKLDIDLNTKAQAAQHSRLSLVGSSIEFSGTEISSIDLQAQGTPDKNSAELKLHSSAGSLLLSLRGRYAANAWQGELAESRYKPFAGDGEWVQKASAILLVSGMEQEIGESCWTMQKASVCATAKHAKKESHAELNVDQLPLEYLAASVASESDLVGNISAKSKFHQSADAKWKSTTEILSSNISITTTVEGSKQPLTIFSALPGKATIEADQEGAQAKLTLPLASGGGVNADVSVTSQSTALLDGELLGKIQLDLPDIGFVASLSEEITQAQGSLHADVSLTGSPRQPKPSGQLNVSDTSIGLATPGLQLSNIELLAKSIGDGAVEYSAVADSDEGQLKLKGQSTFLGAASTALTLSGDSVQVWNTDDAQVWASPQLEMQIDAENMQLRGRVKVPRARITPTQLPSSAISVSPDQIIIDASAKDLAPVDALARQLNMDLQLQLGEDVQLDSFGFKGRIEGQLKLEQAQAQDLSASGELNIVDGEYRAYGQGLVVDRGQILFAGGPIDSPAINVRAVRRPDEDILVGVNVRGDAQQPEINLFSEPAMSQSDQLSWLVLGRSLESTSGSEGNYIAQAALALGLRSNDFLANNIGDKIGLDSMAIQAGSGEAGAASDVNSAALVVGKYLTPKLYISYGIGLLDSLSTVKLRYAMTSRWNLTTESSALSSGGDISYTFEK